MPESTFEPSLMCLRPWVKHWLLVFRQPISSKLSCEGFNVGLVIFNSTLVTDVDPQQPPWRAKDDTGSWQSLPQAPCVILGWQPLSIIFPREAGILDISCTHKRQNTSQQFNASPLGFSKDSQIKKWQLKGTNQPLDCSLCNILLIWASPWELNYKGVINVPSKRDKVSSKSQVHLFLLLHFQSGLWTLMVGFFSFSSPFCLFLYWWVFVRICRVPGPISENIWQGYQ